MGTQEKKHKATRYLENLQETIPCCQGWKIEHVRYLCSPRVANTHTSIGVRIDGVSVRLNLTRKTGQIALRALSSLNNLLASEPEEIDAGNPESQSRVISIKYDHSPFEDTGETFDQVAKWVARRVDVFEVVRQDILSDEEPLFIHSGFTSDSSRIGEIESAPTAMSGDYTLSNSISLHSEFAKVISCKVCTVQDDQNLLRDDQENVPQPGYVGTNYYATRVLLIGQNPGTPKTQAEGDLPYTESLRALRDAPYAAQYRKLHGVTREFIPHWPVHRSYFPLTECGLSLDDIAYCNIVRCRTVGDSSPLDRIVAKCTNEHLKRWMLLLQPRVVVFIGKWAYDKGCDIVAAERVPHDYMNRQRSLSTEKRAANRKRVVKLVRNHLR